MEKLEPGLNLARTLLYVSHSLHSQTRCDLKTWLKVITAGRPERIQGQEIWRGREKIKAKLKSYYH